MKKVMMVIATLAMIGLTASQAWAQWGGPMMTPRSGYGTTNNSAYLDATVQIRSDLGAKQAEYNALMTQKNPDPKRAAKLSREISAIREQLRAQSQQFSANSGGGNYPTQMRGYGHGDWGCW